MRSPSVMASVWSWVRYEEYSPEKPPFRRSTVFPHRCRHVIPALAPTPQSPLSGLTASHSSPTTGSPARSSPAPCHWRVRLRSQVGEDVLDHLGIRYAGDDAHRPAAGRASFIGHLPVPERFAAAEGCADRRSCRFVDINAEDPFQALRLRLIAARRSAGVGASGSPVVACWPPLPRPAGVTRVRYLPVRCENPVETGQSLPRT
jgi:hypothetical protein